MKRNHFRLRGFFDSIDYDPSPCWIYFGLFLSKILLKDEAVSKTISVEVGMQNSGLGVVLAKENFVNPAVAIPAAISSLVHSLYGSIFVGLFGIKADGFSSKKDDTNH